MGLIGCDLSQYPLEEHYKICRRYIADSLDWDQISASTQAKKTIGIDVSDVISLFEHLELDPDYRLICYMTSGYHGRFGKVAAVKKGDDWNPPCDMAQDVDLHRSLNTLNLPERTFPLMEAIFNDGSAEGYFEAILCARFLRAIPYTGFLYDRWPLILNVKPDNYTNAWECQVELTDWSPRYSEHTITALSRKIENGFGASDGKDRIYLMQFNFFKNVNEFLLASVATNQPISSNHIRDSKRYTEGRRCCVFNQSSILVAEEK